LFDLGGIATPTLRQVLIGVVAGADQGPGGHRLEAELIGGLLQCLELLRVPVAGDRQVVLGRAQVGG
jgi:hypothetical protein